MIAVRLTGYVDENGQLKLELPEGLPTGKVDVTLEFAGTPDELPWELRPWTEEELRELMTPQVAKSNAEIIAWLEQEGGWSKDTPDGATWVEQQRRLRRERNQW